MTSLAAAAVTPAFSQTSKPKSVERLTSKHPLAITMWDFSWLERRWPGAGYENWDEALDQLKERGYDGVRIDAYPHLVAAGAERTWELLPEWDVQDWGAPARCRVQVQPALNQFIGKCVERDMVVGLSTWFRKDLDDTRMKIDSPAKLGGIWKTTLDSLDRKALPHLLYVDLCNEWPLDVWAPFYPKSTPRSSPVGMAWMREAIEVVRPAYPDFSYTFSFTSEYDDWRKQNVSMLDLLELHMWMTHFSDFYDKVGYHYERFDPKGYDNLALKGEKLYRSDPDHWKAALTKGVNFCAEWSRTAHKPLITTECWSVVDYKDFPLLEWGWIKELCEHGVRAACGTQQWSAMATSNFCGPQFHGMWRDIDWHRRMTALIHSTPLPRA
jgi:hypothetical protein